MFFHTGGKLYCLHTLNRGINLLRTPKISLSLQKWGHKLKLEDLVLTLRFVLIDLTSLDLHFSFIKLLLYISWGCEHKIYYLCIYDLCISSCLELLISLISLPVGLWTWGTEKLVFPKTSFPPVYQCLPSLPSSAFWFMPELFKWVD